MTKDPMMKWTDSRLEELEKRIAEAYKQAEAEITAKMQAYLDRFAKQDAVMAQKWKSGEITKQEYTEWRTNHFMIGKNWQAVKDTIAGDVLKTDLISAKLVNDALVDVYTQNANYAYYQLEKDTGTGLSFDLYDKKAVENLLKDDPDFMPHYEPKTPIVERWNKQHIQSEMLQGILQGESIPKIAKRMSNVTDMDKNASIRNARTYTTSVENQAKMDRYAEAEDAGIPLEKEWMSTLDERTRESHREIDGTRVANGEPFILINHDGTTCEMMYPADPNGDAEQVYNCRCRIVARIKGRTVDRSGRASKLDDKTYEEWKKGKEKEQKDQKNTAYEQIGAPIERPRKSDYTDEDDFYKARENYYTQKQEQLERAENWYAKNVNTESMSIDDFSKWCKNNGCVIYGDISGVDGVTLQNYSERYEKLINDFPEVKAYHDKTGIPFEIAYDPNGAFDAEASHGITFGRAFSDYHDNFITKVQTSGFVFGENPAVCTFDHEFGHQVYDSLKYGKDEKIYDSTREELQRRIDMEKDLINNVYGKQGMSEYATTNADELFAEAFCAWYGGEQNEFTNAFNSFLQRWR